MSGILRVLNPLFLIAACVAAVFCFSTDARADQRDSVHKAETHLEPDEVAEFTEAFNRDVQAGEYAAASRRLRVAYDADIWAPYVARSVWVLCGLSPDECATFAGDAGEDPLDCPTAYAAFMAGESERASDVNRSGGAIGYPLRVPKNDAEIWMAAISRVMAEVLAFQAEPDPTKAAKVVTLMRVTECSSEAYRKSDRYVERAFTTAQRMYSPQYRSVLMTLARMPERQP